MNEDKPYINDDKPYMNDDKPYMYDDNRICTMIYQICMHDTPYINDDIPDMYAYHKYVWYHIPWGEKGYGEGPRSLIIVAKLNFAQRDRKMFFL